MSEVLIEITPSEWEVMRVLWANGEIGSGQIVAILEEKRDWRPTTIKTLLARLVDKALVSTKADGHRYLYRANVSELEAWNDASEQLFSYVCAQSRGQKIAHLIGAKALTQEDVALILESVTTALKNVAKEIPCDCFAGQCTCHLAK